MGGDDDDESRQTISAAQLLSMGSCSAEEIEHIRLIVAWGNAFPAGTNGLSAMLEKGVELAAALQRQDTVCALQTRDDSEEVLAGHVLRGHSASLAFELSRVRECCWDRSLGVDRARHTLVSFHRSYSRGVAARLRNVYINHVNRSVLRFEETSRL